MAVKRSSPNCGRPPSVVLNDDTSEESSITTPWNLKKLVFEDQQKPTSRRRIFKSQSKLISNIPWDLVIAVPTWYLIGVGSICTTKMLLMNEYSLPPLVLTFQQLLIGSTLLHLHLTITGGLQPLPKNNTELSQPSIYFDFVLAGLFNALDFLASNTSFSHSSASFVETIKASEPLTTTSIALFFGIDTLSGIEALSILVLISGVFFSTMANAGDGSAGKMEMNQSIKTCLVVMTANLCFGFRAKSQKLFRAHADGKRLDDANLLMRMEQIGAISMLLPVLIFELPGILERGVNASFEKHCHYWALAVVNAACFCTYCLASCYVLTKISVVQYTCFNCLRRIFSIIFTSVVFGIPITLLGALGIFLSFCGFLSFTHFRHKMTRQQSILPKVGYRTQKGRRGRAGA